MTATFLSRCAPGLAIPAFCLLAAGCRGIYDCLPSADAQGISFAGDAYPTLSYAAPPHINLQLGDTVTATSATFEQFDTGACGFESKPNFTSIEHPEKFTWRSGNPSVASVDSHGTIRGVGRGAATILIEAEDAMRFSIRVDVVPHVARMVISPTIATVAAGDTLRFDAYLVDDSNNPIEFDYDFPYPVNLDVPGQPMVIENWIPGNRKQLLKRFPMAGTYELRATAVVRNLRLDKAAVVTVTPPTGK